MKSGMKTQRQRKTKICNIGVDSKRKGGEIRSTVYFLKGKTKMEQKMTKNTSKREENSMDWRTNYIGFQKDYGRIGRRVEGGLSDGF